jgi:uncharacterized protein with HEPN domain
MPRDPKCYLWDARNAADAVTRFTHGKAFEAFLTDDLLRAAVERQFEIVGEALRQLSQIDSTLASRIPHLRRIVAFRNILVHGYASIDHENVWHVIQVELPALQGTLGALLAPDGDAGA